MLVGLKSSQKSVVTIEKMAHILTAVQGMTCDDQTSLPTSTQVHRRNDTHTFTFLFNVFPNNKQGP